MDLHGVFKMISAAIDIGTNTILMTVKNNETAEIIGDFQEIARLGENLTLTGIIGDTAKERAVKILSGYREKADLLKVDHFSVIATSAMRDAKNQKEIVAFVKSETGFEIEVISGDREATLTYLGGLDGLKIQSEKSALIDIGGGSTEYILGNGKDIFQKLSLNIGTVRLSERFNLFTENPSEYQISKFTDFVKSELPKIPFSGSSEISWVGVAGTATSLSAVILKLTKYQANLVHGSKLKYSELNQLTEEFANLSPTEIVKKYPILNKRQDLILGGCLILKCSFEHFGIEEMTVSDRGLRYGVLNTFH